MQVRKNDQQEFDQEQLSNQCGFNGTARLLNYVL